jgi:hypothetical protein
MLSLQGVASPSLLNNGGVGLDRVGGHARVLWGFAGPAILATCQSCRSHDGEAVLIWHRWCRALIEEGPPLVFLIGVLPVCGWHCPLIYVTLASPVPILTLKGGAGVIGVVPNWFRSFVGSWCIR